MKKNNLFVAGKKAALMALLATSLNTNAKAYDERAYMSPSEQDTYQSYGVLPNDIESKQNKRNKTVWVLASIVGLCGVIYFINDFERNKQKM